MPTVNRAGGLINLSVHGAPKACEVGDLIVFDRISQTNEF